MMGNEEVSVMTDYFRQHRADTASPTSAMLLGAAVGMAVGYLFFTEHGRRVAVRVEKLLDVGLSELTKLRDTAHHLVAAYGDSLDSLSETSNASRASWH
jgi:hypothetical protein